MAFDICSPHFDKSSTGECTNWTVLSRDTLTVSFLQKGGEAAFGAAGLLYAIEGRHPVGHVQTVALKRQDILGLPSHTIN